METTLIGSRRAAELLDVDKSTVVRWARSGKLPVAHELDGYRGDLLFDLASIEALSEEQQ